MPEHIDDDNLRLIFSKAGSDDWNKVVNALIRGTQEDRDNHLAIIVRVIDVTDNARHPEERKMRGGGRKGRSRQGSPKMQKSKKSKNGAMEPNAPLRPSVLCRNQSWPSSCLVTHLLTQHLRRYWLVQFMYFYS